MQKRNKIKFDVTINKAMDDLFGNCSIRAISHHQVIFVHRTHIPLNELTEERIHQEIQKILIKLTGCEGEITRSRKKGEK